MELFPRPAELTSLLESRISNFYTNFQVDEIGRVVSVGDGIARVYGLNEIQAGEIECFPVDKTTKKNKNRVKTTKTKRTTPRKETYRLWYANLPHAVAPGGKNREWTETYGRQYATSTVPTLVRERRDSPLTVTPLLGVRDMPLHMRSRRSMTSRITCYCADDHTVAIYPRCVGHVERHCLGCACLCRPSTTAAFET
ncbi:hypothetical protein M9H77_04084 [Catharanthus roseus]|uniref:Uncharacterized protein n=1 Tax=Catharanthus roseus TaxID=4058 RepID=A0ACC0CDK8_CATRO|nr:hypothetical protein M9H77_04084 [Catharanthus roseus]